MVFFRSPLNYWYVKISSIFFNIEIGQVSDQSEYVEGGWRGVKVKMTENAFSIFSSILMILGLFRRKKNSQMGGTVFFMEMEFYGLSEGSKCHFSCFFGLKNFLCRSHRPQDDFFCRNFFLSL